MRQYTAPWKYFPWMKRANEIYQMWHQKYPKSETVRRFQFPDDVRAVGLAETIDYDSDKWERDNDFYPYGHKFDSHPTVYTIDGQGRKKNTAELLDVDDLDGEFAMPILAFCTKLVYHDGNRFRHLKFANRTVLTCSDDCKTLVILSTTYPVFIRGGQMIATERGIVK